MSGAVLELGNRSAHDSLRFRCADRRRASTPPSRAPSPSTKQVSDSPASRLRLRGGKACRKTLFSGSVKAVPEGRKVKTTDQKSRMVYCCQSARARAAEPTEKGDESAHGNLRIVLEALRPNGLDQCLSGVSTSAPSAKSHLTAKKTVPVSRSARYSKYEPGVSLCPGSFF
jgi:hypothetical protein